MGAVAALPFTSVLAGLLNRKVVASDLVDTKSHLQAVFNDKNGVNIGSLSLSSKPASNGVLELFTNDGQVNLKDYPYSIDIYDNDELIFYSNEIDGLKITNTDIPVGAPIEFKTFTYSNISN